jgi:hypothetical protein
MTRTAITMLLILVTNCAGTATTRSTELGPDVVVLKELVALYEPVPFDHRAHAGMSQMWNGCTTCHHRSPQPTTQSTTKPLDVRDQNASETVPACRSCHEVGDDRADVRMPSLKGAYHRQCLNCHKEWTHENACVMCHKPLNGRDAGQEIEPTPDDIVGRMHPPIVPPKENVYAMRFTPAAGGRVTFRHDEHVGAFGLRCVNCHHENRCSNCHDSNAGTTTGRLLRPGRTWRDSHGPCVSCHQQDHCDHCHYPEDQRAPPAFEHQFTGQVLDKDHAQLACAKCHAQLKLTEPPTCGGARCHKSRPAIALPTDRPGPLVATTRPAAGVRAAMLEKEITLHDEPPTTRPATTRPSLIRIRR